MRSVADALRERSLRAVARLSPAERVELAFALGDDDLELLSASRRVSLPEAKAMARQTRRLGRRGSTRISGAGA